VCPECGCGPRYAKGDNGEDMFVISTTDDFTSWAQLED
jgi:hypothetical protein